MKIKIDSTKAKSMGLAALGMLCTGIGSMIAGYVQKGEQKEAMEKIAKNIVEEALKNQAKGS